MRRDGDVVTTAYAKKFCKRYRRILRIGIASGIFPEMLNLVQRLRSDRTDVWAVSSSNHWIIRSAMRRFGIPPDRDLGD